MDDKNTSNFGKHGPMKQNCEGLYHKQFNFSKMNTIQTTLEFLMFLNLLDSFCEINAKMNRSVLGPCQTSMLEFLYEDS